jgi:hypothetical protein
MFAALPLLRRHCPGSDGRPRELCVAYPVPALNAPAVSNQLLQGIWRGAQAGEKQMGSLKGQRGLGAKIGPHSLKEPERCQATPISGPPGFSG